MPGNSFGELFRLTTAGVIHRPGYLAIVDGCPPGLPLSVDDLLPDLRRRRPGQSKIVTQRKEDDLPEIWSGVFEGETDGTSLGILFRNADQRSQDYGDIKDKYRPGHADFTFDAKYGRRDHRGGGRSTARGSENNDLFVPRPERPSRIGTSTNRHGGMLGGISSGEPILCRVAIKPTSSLARPQATVTRSGEPTEIITRGRHDPCLLPRFVPMGEAMVALVLVDHWLRWRAQCGERS